MSEDTILVAFPGSLKVYGDPDHDSLYVEKTVNGQYRLRYEINDDIRHGLDVMPKLQAAVLKTRPPKEVSAVAARNLIRRKLEHAFGGEKHWGTAERDPEVELP